MSVIGNPLTVSVSAESALLVNAETGAILYKKKPHDLHYPASLTKIGACLYVLEKKKNRLNEVVSCPPICLRRMHQESKAARLYKDPAYLLEPDGTHFSIRPEERLKLKDLLFGMMIASGNDASNVVAYHVGRNIPTFMQELNAYLEKLGCQQTLFLNPHGLHHPQHRTTAFDLAIIAREALKNDVLCEIMQTKEYHRPKTNMQPVKTLHQKNKLLREGKFFYPAAIGMKTGYTLKAGYTLAAAARKEGRTLIAILLNCPSSDQRFRDAIRLFDAAFEEEKIERLLFNSLENVFERSLRGAKGVLKSRLAEDVSITYYPSEEPVVKIELDWQKLPLPIEVGTVVGELRILHENETLLASHPLYATKRLEQTKYAFAKAVISGTAEISLVGKLTLVAFLILGLGGVLYLIFKLQRKA
ncbi:MAG: D-alanyl-D-alanine carboxypeptidase family protein [Chlamydiota bacterium]